MASRRTRGSVAKEAGKVTSPMKATSSTMAAPQDTSQQLSSPPATPAAVGRRITVKKGARLKETTLASVVRSDNTVAREPMTPASNSRKRKRAASSKAKADPNELPHGLGTSLASSYRPTQDEHPDEGSASKKAKAESPVPRNSEHPNGQVEVEAPLPDASKASPSKRARRPAAPYGHRFGETPFPDFERPTPEECCIVNDLLSSLHGEKKAPAAIPAPSETFAGCGEVPCVLDAMIRTRLSANTSGKNSGTAIKGMIDAFGTLNEGTGKGSVNWDLVRRTPLEKVVEAIKGGGNQNKKGLDIKNIVDMVYEENQTRRKALDNPEVAQELGIDNESTVQQSAKISCADPNVLSLDHMHALSYHDAFAAFIKYPGIALKTASCVCLYSLQRPSFAVDTHVHRITGWLGWRPEKANENKTFSHLEYMIPDELKYSLHTLFVQHGKECVRCNSKTHALSEGWEDGCVIDHLVKRIKNGDTKRALKGTPVKMAKKGKEEDESEEDDEGDEESSPAERAPEEKVQSGRVAKNGARGKPRKAATAKKLPSAKKGKSKRASTKKNSKPSKNGKGKQAVVESEEEERFVEDESEEADQEETDPSGEEE